MRRLVTGLIRRVKRDPGYTLDHRLGTADLLTEVMLGKYSLIEATGVLWNMGVGLYVGNDSSVGDYSYLGCDGGIRIGANVLMGQRVSLHSQNHVFDDITQPIKSQGVTSKGIVVE